MIKKKIHNISKNIYEIKNLNTIKLFNICLYYYNSLYIFFRNPIIFFILNTKHFKFSYSINFDCILKIENNENLQKEY